MAELTSGSSFELNNQREQKLGYVVESENDLEKKTWTQKVNTILFLHCILNVLFTSPDCMAADIINTGLFRFCHRVVKLLYRKSASGILIRNFRGE